MKKFLVLLLALIMVLSLAACGGRDVSSAPAESKKPSSSASAEKPSDKKDSSEAEEEQNLKEDKEQTAEERHNIALEACESKYERILYHLEY